MRHLLLALLVLPLAAPSTARANSLDERCRALGASPPDATVDTPKLEATISMAECLFDARVATVHVQPTEDSVQQLEDAARPAFQLLEGVIEHGDLEHRMIAEHAKGDLYQALAVRVRSAVSPIRGKPTLVTFAKFKTRVDDADSLVQPWLQLADDSYSEVSRLAKADPGLLIHNPVLASIVYDANLERAARIATR